MANRSERADPKVKPRFPRLRLMELRRKDDERFDDSSWPDMARTVHHPHH